MEADTTTAIDRVRPTAIGGLGIVLISIVASILAYGPLGETIRIRWTIGPSTHYGPEHASTVLMLIVFPFILTGLYLGALALRRYVERTQDPQDVETIRTIIDLCTLLMLGIGLVSQLGLILLNL